MFRKETAICIGSAKHSRCCISSVYKSTILPQPKRRIVETASTDNLTEQNTYTPVELSSEKFSFHSPVRNYRNLLARITSADPKGGSFARVEIGIGKKFNWTENLESRPFRVVRSLSSTVNHDIALSFIRT